MPASRCACWRPASIVRRDRRRSIPSATAPQRCRATETLSRQRTFVCTAQCAIEAWFEHRRHVSIARSGRSQLVGARFIASALGRPFLRAQTKPRGAIRATRRAINTPANCRTRHRCASRTGERSRGRPGSRSSSEGRRLHARRRGRTGRACRRHRRGRARTRQPSGGRLRDAPEGRPGPCLQITPRPQRPGMLRWRGLRPRPQGKKDERCPTRPSLGGRAPTCGTWAPFWAALACLGQ